MIIVTDDENPPPGETTQLDSLVFSDKIPLEPPTEASLDSIHFYLLHATLGHSLYSRTSRVHGAINGLQVTIRVESGSSHNIIQPWVEEFLKIHIKEFSPLFVFVGNYESTQCNGCCTSISVTLSR